MAMSYGPQNAQMNEKPALKSSLDLTLTQHPRDENLKPREVRVCLEIDPPQAWCYCIFPNFRNIMILLQVNPISGDDPKIVCEGCYETKDTYFRMVFNS
jgi:hypothetical protein